MDENLKPRRKNPVWLFLTAIATAGITSYGSYKTSKAESEARTAAGYSTLSQSVKELQQALTTHIAEDDKQTAGLEAKMELLIKLGVSKSEAVKHTAVLAPAHHIAQVSGTGYAGIAKPAAYFNSFKGSHLPDTLEGAVQQQQQSKK